ncbi:MAG: amino acid permease [Chloroflexota bacterium]|nr:amino acid permease [Chloroflexota bacterium]
MPKRQLVRTLGLVQILMLSIGGTMGAGVFVLTGHAAGMVGPALILTFLLAGLLEFFTAMDYAELASSYPIAGGGYAYVSQAREGFLPFSVGWVSWFGAMFYSALCGVGFALSLKIFLPFLPVSATAVAIVVIFAIINSRGSEEAGSLQVILGGVLLTSLIAYAILELVLPGGFTFAEFYKDSGFFIHEGTLKNMAEIFKTLTLVNVLFVGYEVIGTAGEEANNPGRNIPIAIVATLVICVVVYVTIGLVSLGVISAKMLGTSPTPLSDAASRFLGRPGALLMGIAGLVATLSSLNTAMIGATRIPLALSRDGYLPAFLSRIHPRLKTPLPAILFSGGIITACAAIGREVFLGYGANFGYLYLLTFANLSLIWLRRKFPDMERPFRIPFYPAFPIFAAITTVLMGAFIEPRALMLGAGLLAVGLIVYQLRRPVERAVEAAAETVEAAQHEILVSVANPRTAESLIKMAAILGQAREEATLAALSLVKIPEATPLQLAQNMLDKRKNGRKALLQQVADYAHEQGVPVRTLLRATRSISEGILSVAEARGGVGLILMGWRGQLSAWRVKGSVVKGVMHGAQCDVAVLRDRGMTESGIQHVLVPTGGGPHARLALRLGWDIASTSEEGSLTALRILPGASEMDMEVEMDVLRQLAEDVLGEVSEEVTFRLKRSDSLAEGILAEAASAEGRADYDLIVIGASEEWFFKDLLFGSVTDRIADGVSCSVLMVRKYEPAPVSWLRRMVKPARRQPSARP